MAKCIKCEREYNHYKNICPQCRGQAFGDTLLHVGDDVEFRHPSILDAIEENDVAMDSAPIEKKRPPFERPKAKRPVRVFK